MTDITKQNLEAAESVLKDEDMENLCPAHVRKVLLDRRHNSEPVENERRTT